MFVLYLDVSFFSESLEKYNNEHEQAVGILEHRSIGMILVDCKKLKEVLIPSPLKCLEVRRAMLITACLQRFLSATLFFFKTCQKESQQTLSWGSSRFLATSLVSSRKMTTEERAQKFHTHDVSLPKSKECFWWVLPREKFCFVQSKALPCLINIELEFLQYWFYVLGTVNPLLSPSFLIISSPPPPVFRGRKLISPSSLLSPPLLP